MVLHPKILDHIDELRCKVRVFRDTGAVGVNNGNVGSSNSVIPGTRKPKSRSPASWKCDYPGSHDTVIDLVHPSLFPLIYVLSRVSENGPVDIDNCFKMIRNGKRISCGGRDP